MTDQQRPLKSEPFNKAFDIPNLALKAIIGSWFPFAVAVTTLVKCNAMEITPEHQADDVPCVSVEAAAMQKHNWWTCLHAPIEIVQADPVDNDVVRLGKSQFRQFEAGKIGRELKVFNLFEFSQHNQSLLVCFFPARRRQVADEHAHNR